MKRTRKWISGPGQWLKRLDTTSRQILVMLVGMAVITALPAAARSGDWTGLFLNLGTEFAGGAVTFVLLDQILGNSRRKTELLAQLGSKVNEEAIRATEELARHGWLYDGTLNDLAVQEASFRNANFRGAVLRKSYLVLADLRGATLISADLTGADLSYANLEGAHLAEAELTGADLSRANLKGAFLRYYDLDFFPPEYVTSDPALSKISKMVAKFDENTILPDGTKWTPDTDMARFIKPDHPEFWRTGDPRSPAYRGDGETHGE